MTPHTNTNSSTPQQDWLVCSSQIWHCKGSWELGSLPHWFCGRGGTLHKKAWTGYVTDPLCHTSSLLVMLQIVCAYHSLTLPVPHTLSRPGVPSKPSPTAHPLPGNSLVSFAKCWVFPLCVPVNNIPTKPPGVRVLKYFNSQLCIPAPGSGLGTETVPG